MTTPYVEAGDVAPGYILEPRYQAQSAHERFFALVLELDLDTCANTYGVAPCTAAGVVGTECYNTFSTCQDTPHFVKTTKTLKFCGRGVTPPAGEELRPYIAKAAFVPTEIVAAKGLAMRSQTQIQCVDEPCLDTLDPYRATRPAPAAGSFWPRLIARNPNTAGRFARARKGYVVTPWDWNTFDDELYIIDALRGPDGQGVVTVVLSDAIKLLDRAALPVLTGGKLQADFKAIENTDFVAAAGAGTVTLGPTATVIDSAYNGMEIYIDAGMGTGQRRVISSYIGTTRVATLASAWAVIPDPSSAYQVSALAMGLGAALGAQYADPATSGKPEFIRVGDEIIRYTSKSTDTLSWPDATYRAQFGTARSDHKAGDAAQLCRAWMAQPPAAIVQQILNEGGITDDYIDLAGLLTEAENWWSSYALTACIAEPTPPADLLADLLIDLNAVCWWDSVAQMARVKANMPQFGVTAAALTDSELIAAGTTVERQDALRITQAAVYYGLNSAVANRTEAKNYLRGEIFVDTDAQSPNSYGDVRQDLRQSRWLDASSNVIASANAARKVSRLRDTPVKMSFKLDPRNDIALGDLADAATRRNTGVTGSPATVRMMVTKRVDQGTHLECEALSTTFNKRYGFISAAGFPDYGAASAAQREYAFISTSGGLMSDGTGAYLII